MQDESFDPNIHEYVDEKAFVRKPAVEEHYNAKKEAHIRNQEKSWFAKLLEKDKDADGLDILQEKALIDNVAVDEARNKAEKNLPKARLVSRR